MDRLLFSYSSPAEMFSAHQLVFNPTHGFDRDYSPHGYLVSPSESISSARFNEETAIQISSPNFTTGSTSKLIHTGLYSPWKHNDDEPHNDEKVRLVSPADLHRSDYENPDHALPNDWQAGCFLHQHDTPTESQQLLHTQAFPLSSNATYQSERIALDMKARSRQHSYPNPSDSASLLSSPDQERRAEKRRKRMRKPSSGGEEQLEQEKHRERNRLAAARCRRRQNDRTQLLVDRVDRLEDHRETLYATAGMLNAQVLSLKEELLLHNDCDCKGIQQYLQLCVEQLLQRP